MCGVCYFYSPLSERTPSLLQIQNLKHNSQPCSDSSGIDVFLAWIAGKRWILQMGRKCRFGSLNYILQKLSLKLIKFPGGQPNLSSWGTFTSRRIKKTQKSFQDDALGNSTWKREWSLGEANHLWRESTTLNQNEAHQFLRRASMGSLLVPLLCL